MYEHANARTQTHTCRPQSIPSNAWAFYSQNCKQGQPGPGSKVEDAPQTLYHSVNSVRSRLRTATPLDVRHSARPGVCTCARAPVRARARACARYMVYTLRVFGGLMRFSLFACARVWATSGEEGLLYETNEAQPRGNIHSPPPPPLLSAPRPDSTNSQKRGQDVTRVPGVALWDYTPQNPDEMTLVKVCTQLMQAGSPAAYCRHACPCAFNACIFCACIDAYMNCIPTGMRS